MLSSRLEAAGALGKNRLSIDKKLRILLLASKAQKKTADTTGCLFLIGNSKASINTALLKDAFSSLLRQTYIHSSQYIVQSS
jgi:hypothetical protein